MSARRRPEAPEAPQEAQPDGDDLIEQMLADAEVTDVAGAAPARVEGVIIGRLTGFDGQGAPLVEARELAREGGVAARSVVTLGEEHVGREVALLCEGGDRARPLVMGLLHAPRAVRAEVDGERVEVVAEREIVLRCGDASITLTRDGKVLIKGVYVLTRAQTVNRIQGGSVKIN